ncbi:uncharacterized protein LOC115625398 [Scaptodrosophila lebanonensis]|uniref:Uncharacterized protein LOC115625398 n=1 Tax=Drosophila lebanonensis TaxID=7225 RepID=A0A6J2TMS3_DROLE|nr:uncharacterized protein LOC115625398 [Scaptodrosophila lebanonensis]
MNPICKEDINSYECQKWMAEVVARCRDLFANEPADAWPAWWHDPRPARFKSDIRLMTAYDCHKLKSALEAEVAALVPVRIPLIESSKGVPFRWWQKVLLILIYVGIILGLLLFIRWCEAKRVPQWVELVKDEGHPPETASVPSKDSKTSEHRKHMNKKSWMRHKCRRVFVHSETELQQQRRRNEERERVREARTQRKVMKWTHPSDIPQETPEQTHSDRDGAQTNAR